MEAIDKDILDRLRSTILTMESDFKAESLVAGLIHMGLSPDQIVIQPQGGSKRAVRKDVSDFHTEFVDYDDKQYLFLHVNRDGLYDALPENIFHQPIGGRTEKNKYEIIDEIKFHREEEVNARKFFLPLEFEYNDIRRILYSIEEDFEKNFSNSNLIEIFAEYWPVLTRLDTHHAYIFLRIIPLINCIRNDFELVSKSMSMILNTPISIIPFWQSIDIFHQSSISLGKSILGTNTILGTTVFDGEVDLIIKVGPMPNISIQDYLAGGNKEGLVEELCNYFLGANYFIKIEYVVNEEEAEFSLDGNNAVLGISSRL